MSADLLRYDVHFQQCHEEAVANDQTVDAHGQHRLRFVHERAVHVDLHRTAPTGCPLATRTRRRAFSSVSSHSPSGGEAQVIAPPVPKWSMPSSDQNVRIATWSPPRPRGAATHPAARQD